MSSAERERDRVTVRTSQPSSAAGGGPSETVAEAPSSRRDLLRAGMAAAIAGTLGVFGLSTRADARNGQPIRAGARTTATRATTVESRGGPVIQARHTGSGEAVAIRGIATAERGETIGIQGQTASPEGIAGRFTATGGGTAIEAEAAQRNGVALRTRGRLDLRERSGVAPVSGGAEFVIPVSGGLEDESIVLATLQDHFPGIHVEAAHVLDAEEGLIVVRLNQAVPEPARVGWLVLG